MKSLFQSIRSGVITKEACITQLAQFEHDKKQLTIDFLARKLGKDLYTKKLAETSFSIEMLKSIVDKYDDLRKTPLKTKPQRIGTEPDELDGETAFDQVSGVETNNGRTLDDEGPNFSTEG